MWSWAVTSLRVFGRLRTAAGIVSVLLHVRAGLRGGGRTPYYFSTQGCRLEVSWFSSGLLPPEVPLAAAAALRALGCPMRPWVVALLTSSVVGSTPRPVMCECAAIRFKPRISRPSGTVLIC